MTESPRPGLLPRAISVDDRLLDELAEQLSIVVPRYAWLVLRHQDDDHLLLRVDPERGAGRASPAVLAGGSWRSVEARFLPHRESEPERVAAIEVARDPDVTEMVRRHVAHRRAAQQSDAVEVATVEQHLAEARIVARRRRGARAARVILLRRRDVEQLDRLARRLVGRERLRQATDLVLRHQEGGV